MSVERSHDAEPVPAESPATPAVGNRGPVTLRLPDGNRARAMLLSRVIYHDEDTIRDSDPPSAPDLRGAILENAASLVPATEGERKFYDGVDKASIEKGRAWATGRGTTYTDCIDFAIRRLGAGLQKVGKKVTVLPSPVFPDKSPAFVRASKGMDARPSPGDIFIMHSGTPKDPQADSGNFAHTGVIKDVSAPGDGPERWTSYDGGQGTSATLAHLEVTRDYDPETNLFGGKILYGWINVDLV